MASNPVANIHRFELRANHTVAVASEKFTHIIPSAVGDCSGVCKWRYDVAFEYDTQEQNRCCCLTANRINVFLLTKSKRFVLGSNVFVRSALVSQKSSNLSQILQYQLCYRIAVVIFQ